MNELFTKPMLARLIAKPIVTGRAATTSPPSRQARTHAAELRCEGCGSHAAGCALKP